MQCNVVCNTRSKYLRWLFYLIVLHSMSYPKLSGCMGCDFFWQKSWNASPKHGTQYALFPFFFTSIIKITISQFQKTIGTMQWKKNSWMNTTIESPPALIAGFNISMKISVSYQISCFFCTIIFYTFGFRPRVSFCARRVKIRVYPFCSH